MSVLVAVSTAVRPGADYLPQTLAALDAAGAAGQDRVVFTDGPLRAGFDCPWPVHVRPFAGCSRANLWAALRLAAGTGAERLLFFEDDVAPCPAAVTTMATTPVQDDLLLISFFDRRELAEGAPAGVHRRTGAHGFWSTVAVVFPLRSCSFLAARDPADVLPRGHRHLADHAVGRLMDSSPWPVYGIHVPCLVRHIGEISLVHGGRRRLEARQTRNYKKEEEDARSICA